MHEILEHLPASARVLDLGCREGSFDSHSYPFLTFAADLKPQPSARRLVQAEAAKLPFRSRSFDLVLLNHSLEHFENLKGALQEIGRVVKSDGAVYVAVPDAWTLADRVYRKVYRDAGGHINLFASSADLARMLSWYTGLPHVATKTLHSSFSFLNRRNIAPPLTAWQWLLSWRWEAPLACFNALVRLIDRRFATRLSVYGWAFYFGQVGEPVDAVPWSNVCLRCGQAHPSQWLIEMGAVRRKWLVFRSYACPACQAVNFFTPDRRA